jgi:hypothetical protein
LITNWKSWNLRRICFHPRKSLVCHPNPNFSLSSDFSHNSPQPQRH